eukprot:jgi/Ulvmu1/2235/UM013_0082.1
MYSYAPAAAALVLSEMYRFQCMCVTVGQCARHGVLQGETTGECFLDTMRLLWLSVSSGRAFHIFGHNLQNSASCCFRTASVPAHCEFLTQEHCGTVFSHRGVSGAQREIAA